MIEYNKNFDNNSTISFFIKPEIDPTRGQIQFCHNSIVNLFEKSYRPCKNDFFEIRIKIQTLDHYLKGICNITSQYGVITIEIVSSKLNQPTHKK